MNSDRQQLASNQRAIENVGGRVGKVFEAYDESGGTIFHGPKWAEALDRVRRGESAGVAVAYVDRFGRDVAGAYAYAAQLHRHGGKLIIDGRPLDPDSPQDKAMFGMAMVQAELTLDLAKQRSRRTMDDIKRRGINCRVNYGYARNQAPDGGRIDPARDRKAFVVNPEQAAVVKLIYEMRAAGQRWTAIVDELHRRGIPSPTGQPWWTAQSLGSLVRTRVYVGEVKMGDHVTRGAHEPIVTEQVWKAAQSGAARVRIGKRKPGVAYGLLFCSGCGKSLALHLSVGRYAFYGCRRRSSAGPCPAPVNGAQGKLDEFVDELVAGALDGEHGLDVVTGQQDLAAAKTAMEIAIDHRKQFLKGTRGLDAHVIAEALEDLNADVERTQQAYDEALDRADVARDLPESGDAYRRLPVDRRRQVAAALIEELVLDPFPKGASKNGANPPDRIRRPIRWVV
jgi:DNA invertase Pin-like site-specific DNA recombinase